MLQIVTQFCLLHLTPSHAGCIYFVLSSKVHADNFSRRYILCVYSNSSAVDFSIQVQMNQWKIVRLPVWIKCDILYLVRVVGHMQTIGNRPINKNKRMQWPTSLSSNRFMGFKNSGMQPKYIAVCSHKMFLRLFPLIAPAKK